MISKLWNYEIQLVPVVLALLVYELPAMFRRIKKLCYVPIYFSVFPLRAINTTLSNYLGEGINDYANLSNYERKKLRRKIISISIWSMGIDSYFVPLIMGIIFSFFLNTNVFYQFIFILLVYKIVTVTISIKNFHWKAIATKKNHFLLVIVYLCYLGVVYEVLKKSYFWSISYISKGNYLGLLFGIKEIIFSRIVPEFIILVLLVSIFSSSITEKKFLDKNGEEI